MCPWICAEILLDVFHATVLEFAKRSFAVLEFVPGIVAPGVSARNAWTHQKVVSIRLSFSCAQGTAPVPNEICSVLHGEILSGGLLDVTHISFQPRLI
jgi:hypothetical protein